VPSPTPRVHLSQGNSTASTDSGFLLAPLPSNLSRFDPSLAELAAHFGDEWNCNLENPEWLAQAVKLLRELKMVDAGVIPPWFRTQAYCENCGEVLVDGALPPRVAGCPWCKSDKPPRPVQ